MAEKEGDAEGGNPRGEQDPDPADGSQGGWKPPTDGSWIPKVRVDEWVGELKAKITALEAKQNERHEPPPKPLTRAELKALVDEDRITEDAADAYWHKQEREIITAEVTEKVAAGLTQKQRATATAHALEEYRTLVPAAWDASSKERSKVAREYKALTDLGFPSNATTEVAALRAAFGDPDTIRASRSGRRGPGETHVETGGGDKPNGGGADDDGPPKGLDKTKSTYYQRQIDKGIYPDWKAVRAELSFKPTAKRA